jgi:uroporphyrinogen-III synthase
VPVFTASEAIASAAAGMGYLTVTSTGGNEDALCGMLSVITPPGGRVAMFCAERTGSRLRERLRPEVQLDRTVVYEPGGLEDEDFAAVRALLWQVDAITIHSKNAADRLGPLLSASKWCGHLWCISPQASHGLPSLPGVSVKIAEHPTEGDLMSLVAQHEPSKLDRAPPKRSILLPSKRPFASNDNPITPDHGR